MISSPAATELSASGSVLMTWSGGTSESGCCWVRMENPRFCNAAIASAETCPLTSGTCTSRVSPPNMLMPTVTRTVNTASTATATTQRATEPLRGRSTYRG